jgi:Zn-dependent peptidase ImmA (M78 family)
MKVKEILTEGLNKKDTFDILHDFIRFAAEDLELKTLPKFDFKFDNKRSLEHKSFGGYQPGAEYITITVVNRHIMDVCRTLAHELVHYSQDLKKELEDDNAGTTGSPQENEANARAAVIMRNWGKKHPDYFGKESIEQ